MRVFLAGATGAIGRPLVDAAAGRGPRGGRHDARRRARPRRCARAASTPVVLDAFDADAVHAAVRAAEPEVVIHQLTALPAQPDPKRMADAVDADRPPAARDRPDVRRRRPRGGRAARSSCSRSRSSPSPTGAPSTTRTRRWRREPRGRRRDGGRDPRRARRASTALVVALWVLLRPRHLVRAGRGHRTDDRQAPLPADRLRRGPLLVHPRRRRRGRRPCARWTAGRPGSTTSPATSRCAQHVWLPHAAQLMGAKPPRSVPAWLARRAGRRRGRPLRDHAARATQRPRASRRWSWRPRPLARGLRGGLRLLSAAEPHGALRALADRDAAPRQPAHRAAGVAVRARPGRAVPAADRGPRPRPRARALRGRAARRPARDRRSTGTASRSGSPSGPSVYDERAGARSTPTARSTRAGARARRSARRPRRRTARCPRATTPGRAGG